MALVEYLYVDEKRLDSYFEQISSPVTYDKVPTWHGEISFTGPKAGGTQQRFARAYTVHEKISEVEQYLENERLVGSGSTIKTDFRTEKCRARRVVLPPRPGPPDYGGLALWMAIGDRQLRSPDYGGNLYWRNLYLLEDAGRSEDRTLPGASAFTTLGMIVEAASDFYEGTDRTIFKNAEQIPLSDFSDDPTRILAQLGAHVGPERNIRTLYRIRTHFVEFGTTTLVMFGYPIFVAESTDAV